MSTAATVALALTAVWLCVLTVGVLLCVRQLGALTVRMQLISVGAGGATHGSSVGFRLNEAIVRLLPPLEQGRRVVLLLSTTCTTCAGLVDELKTGRMPAGLDLPSELVVLVPGRPEDPEVHALASALSDLANVVLDPVATSVARGLRMANVPSALLVEDGLITGNLVFVDDVEHIERMLGSLSPTHGRTEDYELVGS